MFGRATIRLGIGPHSSLLYFTRQTFYDFAISIKMVAGDIRNWKWQAGTESCFLLHVILIYEAT